MSIIENLLKIYRQYKRKKSIHRMTTFCLKKKHLTSWESNFIKAIKGNCTLTSKQYNKLLEIYKKQDKPRRLFSYEDFEEDINSDSRFCEKYGVSYDDVHNFDR